MINAASGLTDDGYLVNYGTSFIMAMQFTDDGPEGYALVWDSNRTTLRAVTLGGRLPGDRVEVVSGLAPGEKLVRAGP